MSLMKWFRKNNKKIMAIVVILLLIGFLGGSYFSRLANRRSGVKQSVATFFDGREITNYDIMMARQELEILKMLRMDVMLKSSIENLHYFLLGELLFPERSLSPILLNRLKQVIRAQGLEITDQQLSDIYEIGISRDVLWLLLTEEAKQAGITLPDDTVKLQLVQIIPQLYNNQGYRDIIASIVQRSGLSEDQIVHIFSKVLNVVIYAEEMCSNVSLTMNQLSQLASYQQETINAELVRFHADLFIDDQNEPSEEALLRQFEKFKTFFPGQINKENPFGFGYKLPDMASLEYLVVKKDDVSDIVQEPAPEEVEDYYQRHRQDYTTTELSDPNDPNSAKIQKQRTYAEVATQIAEQLLQSRVDAKAEEIIQRAKNLTEAGFEQEEFDITTASAQQIKTRAGDYGQVAQKLSEEYGIPMYQGQTGLLSISDMMNDRYLGMMSISSASLGLVRVTQVVFAIDELQVTDLGLYDIPEPRMYQNIGPAQDFTGQIVALLRVVEAQKKAEPNSIHLEFDKSSIQLDRQEENIYSIKEEVIRDVKRLSAFKVAKNKADEFRQHLQEVGWDQAIEELNKVYKEQYELTEADPNAFTLENLNNLSRIPPSAIEIIKSQAQGYPTGESLVASSLRRKQFIDRLYELVPPNQESLNTVPAVMHSRSSMSYFVIRYLSVNRLYRQDYQRIKARESYRENYRDSQNLAVIHFNPDNILKRMNFSAVRKTEQPEDVNIPAEPSGRT